MIERETVLKSVEFTQARVLEDYHRNPLCHHSKLNAVFKFSKVPTTKMNLDLKAHVHIQFIVSQNIIISPG